MTASRSPCSISASARAGARSSAPSCLPATGIDAIQSFDKTTGQPEIAGLSSSDTPTSHGESVAEVVHDMAPDATLTFVNYHTELEFDQAVDWLIHGPDGKPRVDIIVHSNSFLDGPFDGTGETAQHGRRCAARPASSGSTAPATTGSGTGRASAGDRDGDTYADMTDQNGLTFSIPANAGMGASLQWEDCTIDGKPAAPRTVVLRARHHARGPERRAAARPGPARRHAAARDRLLDGADRRPLRAARASADGRRRLPLRRLRRRASTSISRPWPRASRRPAMPRARSPSGRSTGRRACSRRTRRRGRRPTGASSPS